MRTGVYKIENIVNGKFYIGSTATLGFKKRWDCHRNQLRVNKHSNKHLQYSWNKHGEQNFKFTILEECLPSACLIREQYYFDTLHPQYNILNKAGSMLGYRHSQVTKQKIGNSSRGKNHPMYLGEFTFYHPEHGYFTGGLVEFSTKFGFVETLGHKLKTGGLSKSHGWVYIGKLGDKLPTNINAFYYNKIYNNRPIYSFYHKEHGLFSGTIPDFMKQNNIAHTNRSTISALVNQKRKMAWGWIFVGEGIHKINSDIEKTYSTALSQNSKAKSRMNNVYEFIHDNQKIFKGTISEFVKIHNFHDKCVRRMVSGKRIKHHGWIIKT